MTIELTFENLHYMPKMRMTTATIHFRTGLWLWMRRRTWRLLFAGDARTYTHAQTHAHAHAHARTHTHILFFTHTLTYTLTHTHTHTGPSSWLRRRDLFKCVTWHVRHDALIRVTWLIHVCVCVCVTTQKDQQAWFAGDLFICVTWLIHVCNMTHLYVWHDTFICVTWGVHFRDMTHLCVCVCDSTNGLGGLYSPLTHSYLWYSSFIHVTRLIHTCDMTRSYVWHASFICVKWLIRACVCVTASTD